MMSIRVAVSRSRSLFLVLAALVLSACAASSAAVRRARTAEYPAEAFAEVYRSAREALLAEGYEIALEDPQRGVIVSTLRWYTKDGLHESKDQPVIEPGAAVFRIGVELKRAADGSFFVHVDGGAQGYEQGNPKLARYEHGDPREPYWVEGKIEKLTVAIYDRVGGLAKAPAGATTAAAK
jgi:hypothetical protein